MPACSTGLLWPPPQPLPCTNTSSPGVWVHSLTRKLHLGSPQSKHKINASLSGPTFPDHCATAELHGHCRTLPRSRCRDYESAPASD